LIAARRREIAGLRADHLGALQELDAEDAELDVADRVIARLTATPPSVSPSKAVSLVASLNEYAGGTPPGTGKKPPNIPTLPEMIREILKSTNQSSPVSLTPKEMAEKIRLLWWPEVTPTEVSPIAWRMAQRGELAKDGSVYSLPPPNAAEHLGTTSYASGEPPTDRE